LQLALEPVLDAQLFRHHAKIITNST
jgi:hypothetical protein